MYIFFGPIFFVLFYYVFFFNFFVTNTQCEKQGLLRVDLVRDLFCPPARLPMSFSSLVEQMISLVLKLRNFTING